jgi:hypothetical protein
MSGMNARTVQFSDRPALRWLSAFPMPRGGTEYGADVFPLYQQADAIRACLTEQITKGAHRPVVMKGHEDEGVVYGTVRDFRILTPTEAATLEVEQKADLECYFGVDFTDPSMARAYDEGRIVYTSPEMRGSILAGDKYAYRDETGHEWPFFVGEFSIVGKPHNKRQTPSDGLRGVRMKEGAMDPMEMILEEIRALRAEVEALKGAPAMEDDPISSVVEDTVEDTVETGDYSPDDVVAMASRIAALEDALKTRDAESVVEAAMSERTFTTARPELVKIAKRDPAIFAVMRDNAPRRPSPQPRAAGVPAPGVVQLGSEEHRARVAAMKEEAKASGKKITGDVLRRIMREARGAGGAE